MRYLTKSRFSIAITCPRKLTYLDDASYANANAENAFLKALADGGHQVGALAKCLFPEGIEIDAIGHDAQVEQTNTLLARDKVVLFEAAIRFNRLFVRIDLLRKNGNILELFEVKAKSFDSNIGEELVLKRTGISSEFKPYLYDVAFQRYVLRCAFPEATVLSHLVMPDKTQPCSEPGLAQRLRIRRVSELAVHIDVDESLRDGVVASQLLHVLPVDDFLDALIQSEIKAGSYGWAFEECIAELEARLDAQAFDIHPGSHCKNCEFHANDANAQQELIDGRNECLASHFSVGTAELASGTVFDLYNFRAADTIIQSGRILLRDLQPDDVKYKKDSDKISLSNRQWLQCEESRQVSLQPIIMRKALSAKLSSLKFPLHFIDFETATPALPFHAGMRPYELLFYQFSHHRMEVSGKTVHATQHLDSRRESFPNFDSVRALATALGSDTGSVIHWWTHERTVLIKIRDQLLEAAEPPADRDKLVAFIDDLVGSGGHPGRLVDLGRHVTLPLVYLPRTKGSSSIKKVLPAILNFSTSLQQRYKRPSYGTPAGIESLNFREQAWVKLDEEGRVEDPYKLLLGRFNEANLDAVEDADESNPVIANGGAAMVAYGLLQSDLLDIQARDDLIRQLLRYCELDTLAMVMIYEALQELAGAC